MLLKVGEYLKRFWIVVFCVMDDIKEIVRNVGDKLCCSVIFLIIRICDIMFIEILDVR